MENSALTFNHCTLLNSKPILHIVDIASRALHGPGAAGGGSRRKAAIREISVQTKSQHYTLLQTAHDCELLAAPPMK